MNRKIRQQTFCISREILPIVAESFPFLKHLESRLKNNEHYIHLRVIGCYNLPMLETSTIQEVFLCQGESMLRVDHYTTLDTPITDNEYLLTEHRAKNDDVPRYTLMPLHMLKLPQKLPQNHSNKQENKV